MNNRKYQTAMTRNTKYKEMYNLYKIGWSLRKIAKKYGLSPHSVWIGFLSRGFCTKRRFCN